MSSPSVYSGRAQAIVSCAFASGSETGSIDTVLSGSMTAVTAGIRMRQRSAMALDVLKRFRHSSSQKWHLERRRQCVRSRARRRSRQQAEPVRVTLVGGDHDLRHWSWLRTVIRDRALEIGQTSFTAAMRSGFGTDVRRR